MLSSLGTHCKTMIQILTEEYPQQCDLKQLFKLLSIKNDNINVRPRIQDKTKWLGCYVANDVPLYLMKGNGSLVDYLVFDTDDIPDPSVDVPIMAFEATKTDSSEAGNALYQRLTKFIEIKTRWPTTRCVHFTSGVEKENVSPSQIQQRRLASTLGVVLYDGTGKSLFSPPYKSVEELIEDRRSCSKAFVVKKGEHLYEINQPLTNGAKKGIDSDPGKGAVISVSNAIFELDSQAEFNVTGHGVDTSLIKNCKNKFWSSTSRFPLRLEGLNMCSMEALDRIEYCTLYKSGEKASSILFHMIATSDYEVIFHNHAGCGKSYFVTPDGKEVPLPKGGGFTYPDLIFIHKLSRTVFVIEAKNHKEIKKGDKQLSELHKFQEFFSNYYPAYKLNKGLCVSAPTGWSPPFTRHPVLFTLYEDGTFF